MVKKILLGLLVLVVVAGFLIVWRPSIPEVDPPTAGSFSDDVIERGRVLAGIGNCTTCHTADPERPYAGGVRIATAFGAIYSTNITPHPDQGIGRWSEQAFARALREGVSRDGSHLYPAFPYTHFTRLSDEDIIALYAYIMSREPADYRVPENTLRFPYDQRLLLAGWKLLFFDAGRWQPQSDKSQVWNRGAYLAEGPGHCSACHSPRNRFGAEREAAAYGGTVVDEWYAPALNQSHSSAVAWTENELFQYLRDGGSILHGVAVGSMAEVIHLGLSRADDVDIRALAIYFADKTGIDEDTDPAVAAAAAIRDARQKTLESPGHGERIFAAACAPCHYNDPDRPNELRPDLGLNSAVTAPDPINLLRVTLQGVSDSEGIPGPVMPGFAGSLSDADIISLVQFLRSTHSEQPAWTGVAARLGDLRQADSPGAN